MEIKKTISWLKNKLKHKLKQTTKAFSRFEGRAYKIFPRGFYLSKTTYQSQCN